MGSIKLRNLQTKSRFIFVFFIFLIFIFGVSFTYANDKNIQFRNLTIADGLSQSSVEAMYQDSRGYIWIGTNDGLNRYDGYDFKIYKYGNDPKLSIASNYIFSIKEDLKGNIWVGTLSGVSKISSDGSKITNYYEGEDKGNLSNSNGADVLVTKDGNILIATEDGLNLYDEKKDSFTRILEDENDLTCQDIYSLTQDENDNIWVGTSVGLNKIDIKKGSIEHFYNGKTEDSISDNSIYKVYSDKHGYVWIGTESKGLNRINVNTNKITRYKIGENGILDNFVSNILRDNDGTIWICTNKGISKYIEEKNRFVNYENKLYDNYSLINNQVFSIIQDNNGLIWVGTYSGISIFNPNNKFEHYSCVIDDKTSLNDSIVHGLYEDKDGAIWVGTKSGGVNIIGKDGSNHDKKVIAWITEENGLSNDSVNYITGDETYIWIATRDGLTRVDKYNKTIKVYGKSDGFLSYNIKTLMIDSKGYLWIGTPDGVNILNPNTDKITDLSYIFYNNDISDTYVQSIYENQNGEYILGTFKEGYFIKINPETKEINIYQDLFEKYATTIYSITEDEEYLWLGTNYGLNRVNKKTKEIKKYTEDDGLPNNNIYGVVIDNSKNIWVSTNKGIAELNKKNDKFIVYNITDGLQSNEFNAGAYYKNKDGSIMFGGINGFNIFDPKEFKSTPNYNRVNFEEFKINDEVYSDIDGMKLTHGANMSIKFFFPDYKDTRNTKYYYKIDELDKDWHLTENNEVNYNKLSTGNYTFKVRAVDHNGVVSEESSVKFYVKPHILFSFAAFICYGLFIVILLYLNKVRLDKLDELVKLKTLELNDEMEKNKELYDHVIRLERNKNNYFINLSHELRTPLNVISSTQQLLLEFNKKKGVIEKNRLEYHLNVMKNNTNRLLNLINNIIDTAKAEHGNYHLNLQMEDIVYIVEETCLDMKDYIESSGIELLIDPDVEEKIIQCDKNEIERCIVNLVDNARKFTPQGGKIEVSIIDLGKTVKISVKDTGVGIDNINKMHIFDRFNQVIDENAETKGGSGLGLTITKHIIDMHKGRIYVESEVDNGSTFTIILPVIVEK